jgi:hypothetical protein
VLNLLALCPTSQLSFIGHVFSFVHNNAITQKLKSVCQSNSRPTRDLQFPVHDVEG